MWTPTTRRQHSRDHLRYGSDLTDQEWEILAPFMPPAARTGRPRSWAMREIMNAIFYILRAGCAWSLLPKDFPPRSTVYGWFLRFRREGLFETINHHLVMMDRERAGREPSPSAAVIDRLDEALVDRLDQLSAKLGISRTQAIEGFLDRGIRESERANNNARSLKYKNCGLGPEK